LIFASLPSRSVLDGTTSSPRADMVQTPDALHITIELPGISGDDLRLRFEPERLIVEGHRERPSWETPSRVVQMEIAYGTFRRVLALPPEADGAGISAAYENGVLQVHVPLNRRVVPPARRIDIA
jgi:HSP20 family protein